MEEMRAGFKGNPGPPSIEEIRARIEEDPESVPSIEQLRRKLS